MGAPRLPAAFVTDFGPMPAVEDDDYAAALGRLGRDLPRPKAVVAMSGHWETGETLLLTSAARPEILYDFHGFPESYYQVRYPCPGAPETAAEAVSLLHKAGFRAETDPSRGLDHGVWAPFCRVYPRADVPVAQISVPARWEPKRVLEIGRALAPLRERGVLLAACGALVHNLRLVRFGAPAPDPWAEEFDAWLAPLLDAGDAAALANYRAAAPSAARAVPTPEHFLPLFFALGAAAGEKTAHHFRAIRHGSGLMRIMTFGRTSA